MARPACLIISAWTKIASHSKLFDTGFFAHGYFAWVCSSMVKGCGWCPQILLGRQHRVTDCSPANDLLCTIPTLWHFYQLLRSNSTVLVSPYSCTLKYVTTFLISPIILLLLNLSGRFASNGRRLTCERPGNISNVSLWFQVIYGDRCSASTFHTLEPVCRTFARLLICRLIFLSSLIYGIVLLEEWNGRTITSIAIQTALSPSIYKLLECQLLPVLVRFDEHRTLKTFWLWTNCSLNASHFKIIDNITHLSLNDPLLVTVVNYITVIVILSDHAGRGPHLSIALTVSSSHHALLHRKVFWSKALSLILILLNIRAAEQLLLQGCSRFSLSPLIVLLLIKLLIIRC